jgi:two-component system response regulator AtoC
MNRDLHAMMADGTFRADLYWRLSNLIIRVPDLAERGDDVAEIAQWILRENLTVSPKAMLSQKTLELLRSHNRLGGFRKLRSVLTSLNFRFSAKLTPYVQGLLAT